MRKVFEFATRDNVKAASELSETFKDGEIAIGFYSETDGVRKRCESTMQFAISGFDSGTAVDVSGRGELFRNGRERGSFAKHFLAGIVFRIAPREIRDEFGGIHVAQRVRGCGGVRGHRTLSTTRVRSSERGALCANQSTSRRMRSEISVAVKA